MRIVGRKITNQVLQIIYKDINIITDIKIRSLEWMRNVKNGLK